MSKLFYKTIIDDIQNEKCTGAELEVLLNAFEYKIKQIAATLARKSWYALEDYATAKQYGIDLFTLLIERKEVLGKSNGMAFLNAAVLKTVDC